MNHKQEEMGLEQILEEFYKTVWPKMDAQSVAGMEIVASFISKAYKEGEEKGREEERLGFLEMLTEGKGINTANKIRQSEQERIIKLIEETSFDEPAKSVDFKLGWNVALGQVLKKLLSPTGQRD